jgi:hypothetical protein
VSSCCRASISICASAHAEINTQAQALRLGRGGKYFQVALAAKLFLLWLVLRLFVSQHPGAGTCLLASRQSLRRLQRLQRLQQRMKPPCWYKVTLRLADTAKRALAPAAAAASELLGHCRCQMASALKCRRPQHCRNRARYARAAECPARVTRLAIPLNIAAPPHTPSFYILFVF